MDISECWYKHDCYDAHYLDVVGDPRFKLLGFSFLELLRLKQYLDSKAITLEELLG